MVRTDIVPIQLKMFLLAASSKKRWRSKWSVQRTMIGRPARGI